MFLKLLSYVFMKMAGKNRNNYLWIGIAVVAIVVLAIVFISNSNNNSQNDVTCNAPYIKVGTSCCLDQNYNSVCDNDEQNTQQETQQEEVKRDVIGLNAIDYDKKTKQIIAPKVNYNEWISDWEVEVIGYDSNGNEIFDKTGSNNAGYSNNDNVIN